MTKINLLATQTTPEKFEVSQGQVFQINSLGGDTALVMITDEDSAVTLTGTNAGFAESVSCLEGELNRDSLVNLLEITATLTAL